MYSELSKLIVMACCSEHLLEDNFWQTPEPGVDFILQLGLGLKLNTKIGLHTDTTHHHHTNS